MKKHSFLIKIICLVLCICEMFSLTGCGESKMSQSQVFAMDTVMTLTAYGKNREAGLSAAEAVIRSMDIMLDPELNTSMVYAMNHANGGSVVVSGQIAEMVTVAKEVYELSGGALEPTIYPLVKLWGFVDGKYYLPQDEEISACMARFCFDKAVLTEFTSTGTYTFQMPEYGEISFGAIAKGCASNYAINAMRNAGVESGIISLGGNVQTLGLKPDGSQWTVAIQNPNDTSRYVGLIKVGETAVVTSGSYQRFFRASNGKTYHHLIKPTSGYPASNTLRSVTILCENGTLADALSTTMFILGESQALNYWRANGGFEMILITNDNRIICTSGLMEQFELTDSDYTLKYTE